MFEQLWNSIFKDGQISRLRKSSTQDTKMVSLLPKKLDSIGHALGKLKDNNEG